MELDLNYNNALVETDNDRIQRKARDAAEIWQ